MSLIAPGGIADIKRHLKVCRSNRHCARKTGICQKENIVKSATLALLVLATSVSSWSQIHLPANAVPSSMHYRESGVGNATGRSGSLSGIATSAAAMSRCRPNSSARVRRNNVFRGSGLVLWPRAEDFGSATTWAGIWVHGSPAPPGIPRVIPIKRDGEQWGDPQIGRCFPILDRPYRSGSTAISRKHISTRSGTGSPGFKLEIPTSAKQLTPGEVAELNKIPALFSAKGVR